MWFTATEPTPAGADELGSTVHGTPDQAATVSLEFIKEQYLRHLASEQQALLDRIRPTGDAMRDAIRDGNPLPPSFFTDNRDEVISAIRALQRSIIVPPRSTWCVKAFVASRVDRARSDRRRSIPRLASVNSSRTQVPVHTRPAICAIRLLRLDRLSSLPPSSSPPLCIA